MAHVLHNGSSLIINGLTMHHNGSKSLHQPFLATQCMVCALGWAEWNALEAWPGWSPGWGLIHIVMGFCRDVQIPGLFPFPLGVPFTMNRTEMPHTYNKCIAVHCGNMLILPHVATMHKCECALKVRNSHLCLVERTNSNSPAGTWTPKKTWQGF